MFHVTTLLLRLLFLLAFITNSYTLVVREPTKKHGAARALASRQHREPRAILDTCVYLDTDLFSDASILDIPIDLDLHIDVCLCLSGLDFYLATDTHIQAISKLFGKETIKDILFTLVTTSSGSQQCSYPPHSHPICSPYDYCNFTCEPPFVRDDTRCVCPLPYHECNGHCTLKTCSSMKPRSPTEGPKSSRRITTLAQAEATCLKGESVCGVHSSRRGFECLDVRTTPESCGGCMYPNPFTSSGHSPAGKDCTLLEGVADVLCVDGQCLVQQCKEHYSVNRSRNGCTLLSDTSAGSSLYSDVHISRWSRQGNDTFVKDRSMTPH